MCFYVFFEVLGLQVGVMLGEDGSVEVQVASCWVKLGPRWGMLVHVGPWWLMLGRLGLTWRDLGAILRDLGANML